MLPLMEVEQAGQAFLKNTLGSQPTGQISRTRDRFEFPGFTQTSVFADSLRQMSFLMKAISVKTPLDLKYFSLLKKHS